MHTAHTASLRHRVAGVPLTSHPAASRASGLRARLRSLRGGIATDETRHGRGLLDVAEQDGDTGLRDCLHVPEECRAACGVVDAALAGA
jgi:hypothetical protein